MRQKRFTLIELLVVITIITILAGLLLPTLSQVRKRGAAISCQNQQRQIGTLFAAYVGDNNGSYPWFIFSTTGGAAGGKLYSWVAYTGQYLPQFGSLDAVWLYYPVPANSNYGFLKAKFKLYTCPAASWIWVEQGAHQSYATNMTINYSLMGINYGTTPQTPLKESNVTKHSYTALLWDGLRTPNADNYWYITQPPTGNPAVDFRHANCTNILFSDGHTSSAKFCIKLPIAERMTPKPCLYE